MRKYLLALLGVLAFAGIPVVAHAEVPGHANVYADAKSGNWATQMEGAFPGFPTAGNEGTKHFQEWASKHYTLAARGDSNCETTEPAMRALVQSGVPTLDYVDPPSTETGGTGCHPAAPINSTSRTKYKKLVKEVMEESTAPVVGIEMDDVNLTCGYRTGKDVDSHLQSNQELEKQRHEGTCGTVTVGEEAKEDEETALLLKEIKEQTPSVKIDINTHFADYQAAIARGGAVKTAAEQIIARANLVNQEFGLRDDATTATKYKEYLRFAQKLESEGKGVVLDGESSSTTVLEYELATYFLFNDGKSYVASGEVVMTPAGFWPGWCEKPVEVVGGVRKLKSECKTSEGNLKIENEPPVEESNVLKEEHGGYSRFYSYGGGGSWAITMPPEAVAFTWEWNPANWESTVFGEATTKKLKLAAKEGAVEHYRF